MQTSSDRVAVPITIPTLPTVSLGNAPIPISSAYNTTDGVFCVTSLLTQLTAYFGANFTLPHLEGLFTGANTTAIHLAKNISSTILCNYCIFAAVDVIEDAYPVVGEITPQAVLAYFNMSSSLNSTVNEILNGTCAYDSLSVTSSKYPFPCLNKLALE